MIRVLEGDCRAVLATLPAGSVQCCVTSPPYFGLRSYLPDGHPDKQMEMGSEPTLAEYIAEMVAVFREVRRVLREDGVLFLNVGDSYASDTKGSGGATPKQSTNAGAFFAARKFNHGMKPKDLLMVPARLAIALQEDGWWLRSDIIWAKPNPMPESVKGSHFSRHMVTIADYERLSGLPYADERAGDDWAGDVPGLSEIEIPRRKAPLSAKSQGHCNSASTRGTCGCEGGTQALCCVGSREGQPSQVSGNGECQGARQEAKGCVSGNGEWEAQSGGASPCYEAQPGADCTEAEGQREIRQNGKDGGEKTSRLREAQGGDRSRRAIHGRDVAGRGAAAQEPLLLLQEKASADDRPRDPGQQGGDAHRGEHRSRVSKLQFPEGRQTDSSLLVGCPGCEKCSRHHGYIFHLSAGRPTSAHEHVFLLTRSARYFYDAEAVAEASIYAGATVSLGPKSLSRGQANGAGIHASGNGLADSVSVGETRNLRNVWTIATQPFPGSHFATMPPDLAERCIKAGSRPGDTILDPFGGAGTTALVADRLQRDAVLIELNPEYAAMARERVRADAGLLAVVA